MGQLTIKNLVTEAKYENIEKDIVIDNAKVTFSVEENKITKFVCDVHKRSDSTWLGGVSAEIRDGKLKHNFSAMDLDDIINVKGCIEEIEAEIAAAHETNEESKGESAE